ncbi:N-alpha-acetyltransferase 35, NatC auxiliary subunit [Gracilariopsis chorda]|uniref:N-alpha-acetyltransferase 35, NatC auxiliary subunit n=1 Tax=Gracilariopsis chorda TaxID=448386 RepID=A0A2V3IEH7_9FLOR|nr:N-alpha-acetyltransferase 35, NatC auxiliary subunit [Gracilariopsis chorda]|eukprot:PXF40451.1 N-alpha-acetyltransferase 35, NatC auxiliary subunit [Gracilariopsis chorda]
MASNDSAEVAATKASPDSPRVIPTLQGWKDVTESFDIAKNELELGEMIQSQDFNLYSAMSAIGLMDPKMDLGCGKVRDAREVQLPQALTAKQIINVMDQLLACEMSWLDSHTLPQTVFSCVYTHRLSEITQLELFTFLRLQLATMDSIITLVEDEKVADEEDFITWTHGFQIRPLRPGQSDGDEETLRSILKDIDETTARDPEYEKAERDAIALRIRFRVQFHRTVRYFTGHWQYDQWQSDGKILAELEQLVNSWSTCPFLHHVDKSLIDFVFDESINRHLLTSSPPRSAPIFDVSSALRYLKAIVNELKAFVSIRDLALVSPDPMHMSLAGIVENRHSLHVAVHAIQCFASEFKPKALTRSLMARMMLPPYVSLLFGHHHGDFIRLAMTDLGLDPKCDVKQIEQPGKLRRGISSLFKLFCRNQGRQRTNVLREVYWWDRFGVSCREVSDLDEAESGLRGDPARILDLSSTNQKGLNPSRSKQIESANGNCEAKPANDIKHSIPYYGQKPCLQYLSLELTARLMVHHWLLGFECNLYQTYEYSAVYFNIGYVLMSLTNATKTIVSKMSPERSMHPLRTALFLYDEGCRWLCKAFLTALEAFSTNDSFDYTSSYGGTSPTSTCQKIFGSGELWYEQRFGMFKGLQNDLVYADHESFLSFLKMQEESLQDDSKEADISILRLRDAADSFLTARRKLEHAKKFSQRCTPNAVTPQVLKAARVAVENSLVISRLLTAQTHPSTLTAKPSARKVSFNFSRHPHFPVLTITCT